jgi:hypothetical protein
MLAKPLSTSPELEQTERGLQGLAYPLMERGLASQARTLIREEETSGALTRRNTNLTVASTCMPHYVCLHPQPGRGDHAAPQHAS